MTPKVITAPAEEPITVAEARAHLEAQPYSDSDVDPADDAMIEAWIGAAREHCENFLGLSLSTRTLEIALDQFPTGRRASDSWIALPMGPVREIVSISVAPPDVEYDSDDVDSDALAEEPIYADGTVNPAQYVFDDYSVPAQVKPASTAWPTVTSATNAVKVRYVAGYGVDSDGGQPLPRAIRAAMLLILGHLFANREDTADVATMSIPNGAEALMRPLRVRLGMA